MKYKSILALSLLTLSHGVLADNAKGNNAVTTTTVQHTNSVTYGKGFNVGLDESESEITTPDINLKKDECKNSIFDSSNCKTKVKKSGASISFGFSKKTSSSTTTTTTTTTRGGLANSVPITTAVGMDAQGNTVLSTTVTSGDQNKPPIIRTPSEMREEVNMMEKAMAKYRQDSKQK